MPFLSFYQSLHFFFFLLQCFSLWSPISPSTWSFLALWCVLYFQKSASKKVESAERIHCLAWYLNSSSYNHIPQPHYLEFSEEVVCTHSFISPLQLNTSLALVSAPLLKLLLYDSTDFFMLPIPVDIFICTWYLTSYLI